MLLLIVHNEDGKSFFVKINFPKIFIDSQLAEDLVNVSQDIDPDIILTVHWNEEDKDGTQKMLQNLIGSARPFEQSQVYYWREKYD